MLHSIYTSPTCPTCLSLCSLFLLPSFHSSSSLTLLNPLVGSINVEYSGFAVDGRPDLTLMVYNPVTRSDADAIRTLLASQYKAG